MWLAVASSLRAFNTVKGSGMPNLRTKFEQSANVLKNPAFAAGLFRLSGIFNTKRLKANVHTTQTAGENSFCRGFKCRVFLMMAFFSNPCTISMVLAAFQGGIQLPTKSK